MSAPLLLAGRLAVQSSPTADSKVESTLVVVEYGPDLENQCTLRTFVPPNSSEVLAEQRRADLESLTLYPDTDASSSCETAQTIMDCSGNKYANYRIKPKRAPIFVLRIKKSTIVRGDFVPLDAHNLPRPTTCIGDKVIVECEHIDCQVVFEDIVFHTRYGSVDSKCGKVFFRRCVFKGGDQLSYAENNTTSVVYESCVFEQCPDTSLLIYNDAEVTVVNCTFRGARFGAALFKGGTLTALHCTFSGVKNGVVTHMCSSQLLFDKCVFAGCRDSSILLNGATTATIKDCRIIGSKKRGIDITGAKRTRVAVQDCVVQGCGIGIHLRTGKTSTSITRTTVCSSENIAGVLCAMDIIGDITLSECDISNNAVHNLVNLTGAKCEVTVDGLLQEKHRTAAPHHTAAGSKPSQPSTINFNAPHNALKVMRALKVATGRDIFCFQCGEVEPADEKFKACSKCNNACYCSRDCQVAHWAEHKTKCRHKMDED